MASLARFSSSKSNSKTVSQRLPSLFCVILLAVSLIPVASAYAATNRSTYRVKSWRATNPVWRGVHLMAGNDRQIDELTNALPNLARAGMNVLVVEVDYNFEFQSHPEVRGNSFITKARAHDLAQAAHRQGIRLIPQLNCLGHQSWSKQTLPLLTSHPDFDETPGQFPNNKDIYCRSWCPQNPDVNRVIFDLLDELAAAFEADAVHVGMDEVFLLASEHCPRCRGQDPAKLFAKAVNDLHRHIVGKRKLEMLMWGDRLLDSKSLGYSEWEASRNGTQSAIDLIPKDIIICDWHYLNQREYPSIPLFLQKGFRVWPSGWQPLDAAQAFSRYAREQKNPQNLGYLCTTWGKVKISGAADWPPLVEVLREWK
jgi:glycosyl hydrolase family 20